MPKPPSVPILDIVTSFCLQAACLVPWNLEPDSKEKDPDSINVKGRKSEYFLTSARQLRADWDQ